MRSSSSATSQSSVGIGGTTALLNASLEARCRRFVFVSSTVAAGSASSELLIPRIDLSELFPVPATRWLGRRGHGVRTSDPIRAIRVEDDVF